MADDRNFDSWNKNQWESDNKNGIDLLLTGKSDEPPNFKLNKINHLVDEIICNQNSSQNAGTKEIQLRCINSAIYAESIKSNCDNSTELTATLSNLSINDNHGELINIYRCEPFISLSTSSSLVTTTNQTKSLTRFEHRCRIDEKPKIQRYSLNGHKVIHISSSISSCAFSNNYEFNENSMVRNRAHFEWLQKKKQEILRKKRAGKLLKVRKIIDEEQFARDKAEHERRQRENFLMWIERKKHEDKCKRKEAEIQIELEQRMKEIELKAEPIKNLYLRQWFQNKEKIYKAQKKEQEYKIKLRAEEKKKRLEESSRAFKIWYENSKNRPKPVTQGLLPHQQATPSYINPIPWVVDDTPSEMQNVPNCHKLTTISTKNKITKTVVSQR
ncbi:hypothetical protein PV327_009186 [Microctonus hyperodae]|uniref:Coiled-coil domain-containing protein n=1 Tax=Microctonus hyperodae TaxID=165561 RepID=A0AA39KVM2_MICHY|nr:hypothetical protein PV327_009186 [Microctonus hyperodae]